MSRHPGDRGTLHRTGGKTFRGPGPHTGTMSMTPLIPVEHDYMPRTAA
jgi:hypothetical protein